MKASEAITLASEAVKAIEEQIRQAMERAASRGADPLEAGLESFLPMAAPDAPRSVWIPLSQRRRDPNTVWA